MGLLTRLVNASLPPMMAIHRILTTRSPGQSASLRDRISFLFGILADTAYRIVSLLITVYLRPVSSQNSYRGPYNQATQIHPEERFSPSAPALLLRHSRGVKQPLSLANLDHPFGLFATVLNVIEHLIADGQPAPNATTNDSRRLMRPPSAAPLLSSVHHGLLRSQLVGAPNSAPR